MERKDFLNRERKHPRTMTHEDFKPRLNSFYELNYIPKEDESPQRNLIEDYDEWLLNTYDVHRFISGEIKNILEKLEELAFLKFLTESLST